MMRFITFNINGLRSLRNDFRRLFTDTFSEAELVCFQETKLSRNLVEEWMAFIPDYSSYFAFPRRRAGYSGVASYCRETIRPIGSEDSLLNWSEIIGERSSDSSLTDANGGSDLTLGSDSVSELQIKSHLKALDSEGRVILTKHFMRIHDSFTQLFVFNVYGPNAGAERTDRLHFKLDFLRLLEAKAKQLMTFSDNNFVIIMGDLNISHRPIDHCEPYDDFESDPGRQWLTNLLSATEKPYFVDAFRHLNPNRDQSFTCWNTQTGARQTNFGTRIDYILVDYRLRDYIKDCTLMSHVLGSDHCPVMLELSADVQPIAGTQLSKLCTRVWPEFGNCRQSTLRRYLCNGAKNSSADEVMPNNQSERNVKKTRTEAKRSQTTLSNFFIRYENVKNTRKKSNQMSPKVTQNTSDLNELPFSDKTSIATTNTITEFKSIDDSQRSQQSSDSSVTGNGTGSSGSASASASDSVDKWKTLFESVPKPPLCSGHSEPCALRRVSKIGPNYGKRFYVCARPIGSAQNKLSRCKYFKWSKDLKNNSLNK